jgi:hypothetical protein
MRAFEIYINGERLCSAGVSNAGIFTATIEYLGGDEEHFHLDVSGLLIPEQELLIWQERRLSVGDDVRIRILESDKVDAPTERFPTNAKQDIQAQKRYVRMMARKFGWKIQTGRKRR